MQTLPPSAAVKGPVNSSGTVQGRALSEAVVAAQEAERKRIARDLHDSVNQLLSTATFRIGMMAEQMAGMNAEMTAELQKTRLILTRGIAEIQRISQGLRPSELDTLGLGPAVRSLCREFEEETSLALNFDLSLSSKRLPDTVELTLYRIVQEALNNVQKHAGASQVSVRLKESGSRLSLTIRDNGKGIEAARTATQPARRGMGCRNMQERASFLGGTCSIQSAEQSGTEVVVHIPLGH